MKRPVLFALFGLLSAAFLYSCDKYAAPDNYESKIVGKWKLYSVNDALAVTEDKEVFDFRPDGTNTLTSFRDGAWMCAIAGTYEIQGDRLTVVNAGEANKLSFLSIDGEFMSLQDSDREVLVYKRVRSDFSTSILGMWQGVRMTGGQTYGDAEHCWEYKSDGDFVYYSRSGDGKWIPDPDNSGNIFFVDGDLAGTRWISAGVEYMECWDIETCNGYEMEWTALRKGSDGTVFSTTFQMKKELSQEEITEKIVGKWKLFSNNDIAVPTDSRMVNTYSDEGTYMQSAFLNGRWDYQELGDYTVVGKDVVIGSAIHTVVSINGQEMIFSPVKSAGRYTSNKQVWKRVDEDFSQAIIGTWEGVIMTGSPTYGDVDHRWEYRQDGTYVYYSKDGEGKWAARQDNDGRYFVDGDYLCCRWANEGIYNREFWDIDTCDDSTMIWSALRQNPDGTTFETVFILVRVTD